MNPDLTRFRELGASGQEAQQMKCWIHDAKWLLFGPVGQGYDLELLQLVRSRFNNVMYSKQIKSANYLNKLNDQVGR